MASWTQRQSRTDLLLAARELEGERQKRIRTLSDEGSEADPGQRGASVVEAVVLDAAERDMDGLGAFLVLVRRRNPSAFAALVEELARNHRRDVVTALQGPNVAQQILGDVPDESWRGADVPFRDRPGFVRGDDHIRVTVGPYHTQADVEQVAAEAEKDSPIRGTPAEAHVRGESVAGLLVDVRGAGRSLRRALQALWPNVVQWQRRVGSGPPRKTTAPLLEWSYEYLILHLSWEQIAGGRAAERSLDYQSIQGAVVRFWKRRGLTSKDLHGLRDAVQRQVVTQTGRVALPFPRQREED